MNVPSFNQIPAQSLQVKTTNPTVNYPSILRQPIFTNGKGNRQSVIIEEDY